MNLQSTSDFIEKVSCDFECLYPESSSESETQPSQTTETTKTDSFYMNQLPLYILLISILSLMITGAIFLLLRRSDGKNFPLNRTAVRSKSSFSFSSSTTTQLYQSESTGFKCKSQQSRINLQGFVLSSSSSVQVE